MGEGEAKKNYPDDVPNPMMTRHFSMARQLTSKTCIASPTRCERASVRYIAKDIAKCIAKGIAKEMARDAAADTTKKDTRRHR